MEMQLFEETDCFLPIEKRNISPASESKHSTSASAERKHSTSEKYSRHNVCEEIQLWICIDGCIFNASGARSLLFLDLDGLTFMQKIKSFDTSNRSR